MGRINKGTVNLGGLEELLKEFDKNISIRVGILGNKATQKAGNSNLTMAELGAVHEFGATINHPGGTPYLIKDDGTAQFVSKKNGENLPKTKPHQIVVPTRSFLRMPLLSSQGKKAIIKKTIEKLHQDGALQAFLKTKPTNEINKVYRQTVKSNIPKEIMNDLANSIAAAAHERVLEAFKTDGFGNWKPTSQAARKRRTGDPNNPTLDDTGDLKNSIEFEVKKL